MEQPSPDLLTDTQDLITIGDFIRWASSRFNQSGLFFGHGTGNAVDDACWLIADALHLALPLTADLHPCRLTPSERSLLTALLERRVRERIPAAYLTGRAWFAGLEFAVDEAVMIPRSPIAELIQNQFEPWLDPDQIAAVLDLCAGSGCIGIATAAYLPQAQVDLAERSAAALRVATRNMHSLMNDAGLQERVRVVESDLFSALGGCRYDLMLSNPPYVGQAELASLPPEYAHEPEAAFAAGEEGLDLVLRILHEAPDYLSEQGVLIVEVGNTAELLQERLPSVPFVWLEFEHGGEGVFLLHREQLIDYHAQFAQAMASP
ncbi:50S ribosomal protein L3 N(5)-glutamine methyltransferase [Thiorhodovibrio frisius]|uniref:Protein-(Glutamine-N5) methyltransferase, ribosomal protein L3-specific n=1 Tax=Thiorhodovibrio frisius TaxID=631362 RepID=H8YZD6_9GAMM|nr:50S ribosomal protein L3 N(5)-glutamine methyltransferase [Thiorhodovibrio frisius]EIC22063.1 protein-(glutamine-N5) methyltransferase, ribosomal protein L3-specific [Thiorhodovibrio frisius]WPL24354.1 50S ribosomal protein L3 glutamine methyltransferase [Thiorhodovibrio frisius]